MINLPLAELTPLQFWWWSMNYHHQMTMYWLIMIIPVLICVIIGIIITKWLQVDASWLVTTLFIGVLVSASAGYTVNRKVDLSASDLYRVKTVGVRKVQHVAGSDNYLITLSSGKTVSADRDNVDIETSKTNQAYFTYYQLKSGVTKQIVRHYQDQDITTDTSPDPHVLIRLKPSDENSQTWYFDE